VVDARTGGTLVRAARDGPYEIQVAPAVVYEALRFKNITLRNALVKLMTHQVFLRLMPEAYSESLEILYEVRRLQPERLSISPDTSFLKRVEADWRKKSGGFWVRARRSPSSEAGFLASLEGEMIDGAYAQAKNARREIMESDWKRNPPMDKTLASFQNPVSGWRGDKFEAWRGDSLTIVTYALRQIGAPYRDWIGPIVDLDHGLLDSPQWVRFWLYEVDKAYLPRQWLRWATSFAQRFRKITPGTPADSQLSTYFTETDLVISADRILLEILEEVRPYSPCKLPTGLLIRGGPSGVADLFERIVKC
jgi:hypothetical protein